MTSPDPDALTRARRAERLTELLVHLLDHPTATGYVIADVDGTQSITCLRCGLTSVNPADIAATFCWRCDIDHETEGERP